MINVFCWQIVFLVESLMDCNARDYKRLGVDVYVLYFTIFDSLSVNYAFSRECVCSAQIF